ncbi:aspartate/glutamate racemase family protein [Salinicola endophyticus]|uniref:Aspartate/glutamate racemase family protein n=1 Tax=Salinicola endophyticus TaxID=1949083 RepID=A0ABY8FBF1_9GAMM|nr:aspartate/glutamate racemase family protein [Salinicola endophyticus]WFF40129.1 aspartate/glutamate racemase family protein [Salinicola endophyticus]
MPEAVSQTPGEGGEFRLGVMMLATRFPRPLGDIGNPASFAYPVRHVTVAAASVPAVVSAQIAEPVVAAFVSVGQQLIDEGVDCLATSCGFVCAIHDRLQARLPVPLVSSALNLLPWLHARYAAEGPIGILTFDADTLSQAHFGRFWREGCVIHGLQHSAHFYPTIRYDRPQWDAEQVAQEVVEAALALHRRQPDMTALLLECTNLSPYRQRLAAALELPVYDIHDAITLARRGDAA